MTASDFIARLFDNLDGDPFSSDEEAWRDALAAFGREAVPALMRQARKGMPYRRIAIVTLGHLRDEAAEAAALLAGILKEKDPDGYGFSIADPPSREALAAEEALCEMKPIAALPQLIRILTHGPDHARAGAASVCKAMGPAARAALPALRRRAARNDVLEETFREAIAAIEEDDRPPRE